MYFEVGDEVLIVEGAYESKSGTVMHEFKTAFGKQFLDVYIDNGETVRKRGSDVIKRS